VIDSGRKCLAVNVAVEDDGKVIFTRIDIFPKYFMK
jgi:hypothetical protein